MQVTWQLFKGVSQKVKYVIQHIEAVQLTILLVLLGSPADVCPGKCYWFHTAVAMQLHMAQQRNDTAR